jgi:hypothetical protein
MSPEFIQLLNIVYFVTHETEIRNLFFGKLREESCNTGKQCDERCSIEVNANHGGLL